MKVIKDHIKSCYICPHSLIEKSTEVWGWKCNRTGRELKEELIFTIPDWCPLEDADEYWGDK